MMSLLMRLPTLPSQEKTLLVCGIALFLTAVVHVFVTVSPRRAYGRRLFVYPRPALFRLLCGDVAPGVALMCGLVATVFTAAIGGALYFAGVDPALAAGPIPGLVFLIRAVVTSLRHHRGHWVMKLLLSAFTSLCVLAVVGLLLRIVGGAEWHLLLP